MKDEPLAITELARKTAYSGFRQLEVVEYREDVSRQLATREIVTGTYAVVAVAHDPVRDLLVMIRQFRLAAQYGTGNGMTCEFVAGMIDPGEDPQEAVRRELREEAGIDAHAIVPMCTFLTTPGLTDETMAMFYVQVDASSLPQEAGEASETEQTFPFTISLEEALAASDENRIYNGIVMVGLLRFAREREALMARAAAL